MSSGYTYIVIEKASDRPIPKVSHFATESAMMAEFNNSLHSNKCTWIFHGRINDDNAITIADYMGPER